MRKHFSLPWCGALALLLMVVAGCANPYSSYYISTIDRWPESADILAAAPEAAQPRLVSSQNMRADIPAMLENGYLMIGKVDFRGSRVDESQAMAQARTVGADVVMVARDYLGTVTQSVPVTEWLPERRLTTTERTTVFPGGDSAPVVRERVITQVLQGEAQINYVPETVEYFNYSATFWRKAKPFMFGVLVHPLDEAMRQRLQSNRGVVVRIVVNRSPAFNADILRDDIITRFAGEPVADPADFFAKVKSHAGQKVVVTIVRNGVSRDIAVTLSERD